MVHEMKNTRGKQTKRAHLFLHNQRFNQKS